MVLSGMLRNWTQKVYDWCDDNGVRLTGHYIEETSLGMQMMCCGGIMPFYEYEHIPGIDWLTTMTNNDIPGRQVGSVAAQLGKKQVLTESFGICGWNVTPTTLRRILGMQYINGVNMLCHHLLPYSEHGQRKTDYPAHYQKINPWVKEHFKEFNDYFTNLGCILAEGRKDVKVAMLYPIRSAYLEYNRVEVENTGEISGLDAQFRKSCRQLSSRGIAYHFIDETLLEKHGFVNKDAIGCGKCEYQYLILPTIYTMGRNTEKLIAEFVANGGRVLLMDEAPAYLEGQPFTYEYLRSNCTLEDIENVQAFKVTNTDNNLYYTHRQLEDKELIFVQNASVTEGCVQTFDFGENIHSFVAINPGNLETQKLPLTVQFEKEEAMLLMPSSEVLDEKHALTEYELVIDEAYAEFDDNYLTVDTVKYSKDGVDYSEPMLTSEVFKKMLQERYEGKIWLKYCFEIRQKPEKMSLIAESPADKNHILNGDKILFAEKWEDEHSFGITDISDKIHTGYNEYEVVMDWFQTEETYYALFGEGVTESLKNCIAYDSEIEPIYLAGRFGVYSDYELEDENPGELIGRGFYIGDIPLKVTDPVRDGLTFFRGKLALTQKIILEDNNVILRIPGDYLLATVFVNDKKVAEMMFDKKVDISEHAQIGENTVRVELTIGNRNMFGPFHVARYGAFDEPLSFEDSSLAKSDDGQYRYKFKSFY